LNRRNRAFVSPGTKPATYAWRILRGLQGIESGLKIVDLIDLRNDRLNNGIASERHGVKLLKLPYPH
jgi:hypothetical protein